MDRERPGAAEDQTTAAVSRIHVGRMVELVRTYLEELPTRQREVLDLVDMQGFAPAEVAEMLDLNAATVRTNLFKARRAVRKKVLERHPELS